MSHVKLLVVSTITTVPSCWDFLLVLSCLPSILCHCACCRKQRLHTPFHFNRECLSQPLSNFIFLWLMLSTHYLKPTPEHKGLVRVFVLHLCVTLHPCLGTLCPITHRSHFLITWLPFGWSPTSALWKHNTVKEGKIVLPAWFSVEIL